jgi:hypothetical protein
MARKPEKATGSRGYRKPRAGEDREKAALTLRLDPAGFRRLRLLAAAENRTPTNWVETVVLRELRARDEANRVLTVASAPELEGAAAGELVRSEGETDARYAERRALLAELLAIPDDA